VRNVCEITENEHVSMTDEENCKRKSPNKSPDIFPGVPSHCCRRDSTKEHLNNEQSLRKIEGLHDDCCKEICCILENKWLCRQIFKSDFNTAFCSRRKDSSDYLTEEEKQV
jgi:hypothetical protein